MNLNIRYYVFFGHLIHLISAWDYKDVDLWENEFPSCGGMKQSPVNLDNLKRSSEEGEKLKFLRYDVKPKGMLMKNNGHTVEINSSWGDSKSDFPAVVKDGIEYTVVQMHFHWGPTDDSGSEHVFGNKTTPLELHIVHWNYERGDYDPEQGEGILVIGVLFELDPVAADFLGEVRDGLSYIDEIDSSGVSILTFKLSMIFYENFSENYLTYTGSLTTPPCSEGVSWVILEQPSTVSNEEMELFREIKLADGDDHNNRPVQSINSRKLIQIPMN